jgi:8-amino-7-oxononanoate synthase
MDIFAKVRKFKRHTDQISAHGQTYHIPFTVSATGELLHRGRRVVHAGSSDYLGLARDPRVLSAAESALRREGVACTSSRLLCGTRESHLALERNLADFLGRDEALVFSTGMLAVSGTIAAIASNPEDILYIDRGNHASIFDGCCLSRATVNKFRHNDPDRLRIAASKDPPEAPKLAVLEGVYSATGDLCDLTRFVEVARALRIRLVVDEAHSLGVLGIHGRGAAEHFDVEKDVDLVVGTFSKSLGSSGGFVAGRSDVIDFLRFVSRQFVFTAALSPVHCAAANCALNILQQEPERRALVRNHSRQLHEALVSLDFTVTGGGGPIVSVFVGNEDKTLTYFHKLLEMGIVVNPFVQPGVEPGGDLLRICVSAAFDDDDVFKIIEAFASLRDSHLIRPLELDPVTHQA